MEWQINKPDGYEAYIEKYQVSPLLAKVFAYKEFDDTKVTSILNDRLVYHDFSLFQEGEMALDRIEEAIENDEKICIYGDYDCDGMLATTILVEAFKQRGKVVGYHIPDRSIDGYGLNVSRVEQMAKKGYTLIITVDNGIKAFDAVNRANELGVDVIITDHHGVGDDIPDACCIVHTKTSPEYPFKEISGGFVAYKLASAMLGKHDKYLYCLAAITTISDMMPLLDENRSLVKRALTFMKEEKYPALELLLGENQDYTVQSLGFSIAPKINSFGRLCEFVNPNHVVRFLMRDASSELLTKMSGYALKINAKRQELTTKQYQVVMSNYSLQEKFLYSYQEDLHEGLIGLVAGKYTRQYHRPSFVLHFDSESNMYKGSARGIEELPLTDVFGQVEDILEGFGGHQLAGGFSVSSSNVEILKQRIKEYIDSTFDTMPDPMIPALKITLNDVTKENVASLDVLQPLGNGNEEVIFYLEDLPVEKVYTLSEGKHLKFDIALPNSKMQVLAFQMGERLVEFENKKTIRVVGKLSINRFRNLETINMIIEDIK